MDINEKIIDLIDKKSGNKNYCTFNMCEVTNFNWDKMLVYDLGSSNLEISKALDIEYKESVDLMTGLLFVNDNKIIFKEQVLYDPEHPNKLQYIVKDCNNNVEPSYRLFLRENAIFKGIKSEVDGVYYYRIEPFNTN
jgi:hypothetical protein